MKKTILLTLLFLLSISCGKKNSSSSHSQDESTQPPFITDGTEYPEGLNDKLIVKDDVTHAPMNFISQELDITFDPKEQTAKGHSVIKFNLKKSGRPYFELQSNLKSMKMNGEEVSFTSIKDPDGQNQSYWSVNKDLAAGKTYEVELDYVFPSGRVTFTNGGVRFLTDMTDLSGRFFEYWGPSGFEEDQFKMTMNLSVLNSTSNHTLYTNGSPISTGAQGWKIEFPDYYSKSSFYVHLTNQVLPRKTFTYQGIEKSIPIEVYGLTQSLVDSAVAELPGLFKELEGDYGSYPHEKFLVYMNDRSGGMEYVGATITALGSLDHELLHSWYGRSVIPADGRSGWIDEAMASWRDYGYKRATSTLTRTPTNLANYSPFRKTTPSNSYVDGRALFAELSKEFQNVGGLKAVMKAFQEKYKHKIITNEEFWKFLESHTEMDLKEFNQRYAMGETEEVKFAQKDIAPSKHPTPLTEEEILRLR